MKSFTLIIIISFIGCKQKFDSKTYTENKQSLAVKEQTHPEAFLKILANDRKTIFGATVVKGKVVNKATVCGYKNTRLKMLCYHNNIRLEEHEDVLADVIKPGTSQDFKTRYHLPKSTDSIALTIMNSEPVLMDTLQ